MDQARKTRFHLPAQTGRAFEVNRGETIRIIDVEGEQVADLVCFARGELTEVLSAGRTIDYNGKLFLSTGDQLYSSLSNPMLTITEDRVGRHPTLYAPCSQEMFEISYGVREPHPNCQDNLTSSLARFGVPGAAMPTPLNLFLNVAVSEDGRLTIRPPRSKAGDFVDLQAEMDLVVGIAACSAGTCNNNRCTAIEVELFGAAGEVTDGEE